MNNLFLNNSDILNSKDNTSSQNFNTSLTELPSNDEITPFDGTLYCCGQGGEQRPCITRQWTPAVLCLGWLDVY
jgi:hypothetical protein